MVTPADPAIKERIDSERNQGRARDTGRLDHDRLGFNYDRLSGIACAFGIAQLPEGVNRDETVRALTMDRVQSKPYLPAIHMMSFYREHFGYTGGELPICEAVAARSLALPFFPQMTASQVEHVAETLGDVLSW